MKIIKAGYEILTPITGDELKLIEIAGRTCYKSEKMITDDSAKEFVARMIKNHHEAMLEHSSLTIKFICDRGVSHELVRHRLASFGQESTRYCNYASEKHGGEITFIKPFFFEEGTRKYYDWEWAMQKAEDAYLSLIENGATPQEARSVLPNSVKTEVVMTANYREWRHFFNLRAARATGPAHPQMEEITVPLLRELTGLIPVVFDDIYAVIAPFKNDVEWLNQCDLRAISSMFEKELSAADVTFLSPEDRKRLIKNIYTAIEEIKKSKEKP